MMMSHESLGGDEGADLHASRDEMESLALDDDDDPSLPSASSPPGLRSSGSPFNSILEPPSYAEAVFTSLGTSSSNGHRSAKSPSTSDTCGRSDSLRMWVSDPHKEQELHPNSLVPGGTSYYTYLITTRTNMPEYGGPGSEFSVRRRFKDVVTLSDRLSESYRGFFVPVRPDKGVVDGQVMQTGQFVEQRRLALEKYLNKLAAHPVIRRSEELRVFLVVKGKLPLARSVDAASRMLDGAVRLPKQLMGEVSTDAREASQPAKGGRDLLRMLKELKQSVANDWGRVKPLVVEEDKDFLDRKDWLVEFEHHLSNISQQVCLLCFL